MAKASAKRSSHVKAPRKTKSKAMKTSAKAATVAHEEDHIDGCDFEVLEADITPDAALPAAKGGVAGAQGTRGRGSSSRM